MFIRHVTGPAHLTPHPPTWNRVNIVLATSCETETVDRDKTGRGYKRDHVWHAHTATYSEALLWGKRSDFELYNIVQCQKYRESNSVQRIRNIEFKNHNISHWFVCTCVRRNLFSVHNTIMFILVLQHLYIQATRARDVEVRRQKVDYARRVLERFVGWGYFSNRKKRK